MSTDTTPTAVPFLSDEWLASLATKADGDFEAFIRIRDLYERELTRYKELVEEARVRESDLWWALHNFTKRFTGKDGKFTGLLYGDAQGIADEYESAQALLAKLPKPPYK